MKRIVFVAGLVICSMISRAQVPVTSRPRGEDSIKQIIILHADNYRYVKKDSLTEIIYLVGNVILQQGKTLFYCDSMIRNPTDSIIESFGHVHVNDNDSTHIHSEYMKYYVNKKNVLFQRNVTLTDGKGVLTTDNLQYDLNQKIGNYLDGGKVVNSGTVLTSKEGTYYANTHDVYFKKNVVLKDPKYDLTTDSLLYNTDTQLATFITKTHIVSRDSSGTTIVTKDGYYDLKNKKAQFGKRPVITQKGQFITGDSVQLDDSTGISIARGNAVYKDTAQGVVVIGNHLEINQKVHTFLATINPLMILKQDQDSIYITADTLFSANLPDSVFNKKTADSTKAGDSLHKVMPTAINNNNSDSAKKYLLGYHHVRIFSDSLQAVSDSLYYSGLDSVFRLFTNPIVWASGNQVTGDTIYLYTKNKKAERMYVFENGMVVSKVDSGLFNQVRGNTLNGYFKDGVIDYMRAKGNAESVYYAKDDNQALIGVNKAKADIIDMIFLHKELNKVVLRSDVEGTMFPLRQVSLSEMLLRNFKWLEAKRPKSRFELFGQ